VASNKLDWIGKPLSSPESMKAVRWLEEDLRLEGFVEKVCFEFGVKRSGSDE